jgi:glycosyltransferase involved in cell wall biosynthesis
MDYNILYFAIVSPNFGGVEQKIIGQFDALHALGVEIQLFLVSSFTPGEIFAIEIEKRSGVKILINSPSKIRNPWARRKEKFDLISSVLSDYSPRRTMVYLRYPIGDMLFLKFLKKNKAYKFVTEHQELENKLRIGCLTNTFTQDIIDFAFGKAIRNKITGFVGVSSQYLDNQISYLSRKIQEKKYFLVNGNGIDTSKYCFRKNPLFDGQTLKLLFVGVGFQYQGLHRLLISMENYYSSAFKVRIIVNIAGVTRRKVYLKKYLRNPKVRDSVVFHGYISPRDMDRLADECHLAVNSLCLHQIGIKIASTLKSREYFARGIPFVTASFDNDFEDNNPFILKVTSDESVFNIQDIIDFALEMNADVLHPQKMRQYAIEHLDWSVKMKKLIDFFDKIIEDIH